ncbi:MAG: hypothetical protein ACP5PT_03585 [Brevinematia bacterium]
MKKFIFAIFLFLALISYSFGLSAGIMLDFPKNYKQTVKIGLWDIGFSYKFWNFGMQVQANWIPYIFGVYNLSSKLSYSFKLDQGKDISIGAGIKGYYDTSSQFIKNNLGYDIKLGLNGYKAFIALSFNLFPYDLVTFGINYSSLKRDYISQDYLGIFVYSYVLSFNGVNIKVPLFSEFAYSLGKNEPLIGFGNIYSSPYSISFGFVVSFWKEFLNVKAGVVYPGVKLPSSQLVGFNGLDLPFLPYFDIYLKF